MARHSGGAIVIDAPFGGGDWLDDAKRIADAARSLNSATRRMGGQLRATAAGYVSAVSKAVRAVEGLRDEQLLAFGDTARAWESARTRLNGLSASLGALKRSLRDAFVPILTAAAPALTTLTDLLTRAVSAVGSFMAALTGQDAFLRAAGEQREYAEGLRGSTRAAKALKRQLASFDELDILRDSGQGSGGGGLSAAATDLSGQLALLPVDEGILRFARELKALFEAGDYDGLGRTLADALNGAIERARAWIRWENVGEDVTRVVAGVCAAFNGLVDGVNWTGLGGALGDGIDTLLRTADRLLGGIDFPSLGRALGDALNGALTEIDFDVLGETLARLLTAKLAVLANAAITFDWGRFGGKLAEGLSGLVRTMGEALDGIDWSALALSLTQGLNRFIADVNWTEVGGFVGGRLSDALGAMRTAVSAFDWGRAGDALSSAVNGLVKRVDWVALGQWLDRTIKGVLDFGIRFLKSFDSDEFASGLRKALDQVDWDGIARKLWTLLSEALGKFGGLGSLLGLGGGGLDGLLSRSKADVPVRLVKQGWTSLDSFVGTSVKVNTNLGKGNWSSLADFIGASTRVLVSLGKDGWSNIAGFVGDRVTALVSLARQGWNTLSGYVGDSVTVQTALQRSGWTSLMSFVGADRPISAMLGLVRQGWSSLDDFVGVSRPLSALVSLVKNGWNTLAGFTGDAVTVRTSLTRNGWSSISGFVGDEVSVWTRLLQWGWSSIEEYVGDEVSVWTQLKKWGWNNIENYVGDSVSVFTALRKNGWNNILEYITGNSQGKITITATVNGVLGNLANVIGNAIGGKLSGKAKGGWYSPGGIAHSFAAGGMIGRGGRASWWDSAVKYARGTRRAHGTMFIAGEAGPEIVGHVNGRTEILNRSQLAQTMYSAVTGGMAAALRGITFTVPAMATGGVMPYEVSAQIAKGTADLQGTLDANNEDLIQTIVNVAGQIVAAIQRGGDRQAASGGGLTAQQIINEINRRTQMYSQSPLKGV